MALSETAELQRGAQRFLRAAMKKPMLEADHERELARLWRDEHDEHALHELTMAYMRLVVAMASRFRHYGLPLSDLVQEGNVGLMQAAMRFEPDREVRFSTYASWWIRSAMQDFVLRNWSIVRTGTTSAQKALFFNLRRLRARIGDVGDAVMSAEATSKVAKALRVPEQDVVSMAARLYAPDRSLNAPLTDEGDGEWQDLLPDSAAGPEADVMESHDNLARAELVHDRDDGIEFDRPATLGIEQHGGLESAELARDDQQPGARVTPLRRAISWSSSASSRTRRDSSFIVPESARPRASCMRTASALVEAPGKPSGMSASIGWTT